VAGVNKIRQSLRPGDRARIVTFGSRVHERTALADAASLPPLEMPAGALDAFLPSSQTTCYDAITLSIVTPPTAGRRQVAILFSADRDTASFLESRSVLEVAQRSGTVVFVVRVPFDLEPTEPLPEGVTHRETPVDPLAIPSRFFKELAEITGGRVEELKVFTMLRNDSQGSAWQTRGVVDVGASFVRALDDFRSSYVLRYMPEGVPREGWHDIVVGVATGAGRYEVRARRGYIR
jgi:hypothetical protein